MRRDAECKGYILTLHRYATEAAAQAAKARQRACIDAGALSERGETSQPTADAGDEGDVLTHNDFCLFVVHREDVRAREHVDIVIGLNRLQDGAERGQSKAERVTGTLHGRATQTHRQTHELRWVKEEA